MGLGKSKEYIEEISDSESDSASYFESRGPQQSPQSLFSEAAVMDGDLEVSLHTGDPGSSAGTSAEHKAEPVAVVADNAIDARARPISMPDPEEVLSPGVMKEIEQKLDEYEIVSLIYLLTDLPKIPPKYHGMQKLNLYLQSRSDGKIIQILTQWAEQVKGKWQLKLIEALCIIQNYKVLKELGYKSKTDLKLRFFPQNGAITEAVDKTRKRLYLMAEKFDDNLTLQFLNFIKKEFAANDIYFYEFNSTYLELYFLDWEIFHPNDFSEILKIIKKVLKQMDLEVLGDNLVIREVEKQQSIYSEPVIMFKKIKQEDTVPKSPQRPLEPVPVIPSVPIIQPVPIFYPQRFIGPDIAIHQGYPQGRKMGMDNIQGYVEGGEYSDQSSTMHSSIQERRNSENSYNIDRTRPGKLLIIDQKDFYTEPDEIYNKLKHKNNDIYKLETRLGTERDKERLEKVFKTKFGFQVKDETNLAHYDMIKEITNFVESITDESSLFICILSHGEKGVVYGSNSCWVPVDLIEKIMVTKNKANLKGKPKVLILQSCQGLDCQKVEEDLLSEDEDEDMRLYTRDSAGPKTADVLKFWATVPGYAAVRNKVSGSWFIQAFCDALEKYHADEHLLDICTRVNNMVSNKKWKEDNGCTNIMMPMLVHTFRRQFYFPVVE